jgi:hypothetical protein
MGDASTRKNVIELMTEKINEAAVMWNLVEAMFQLPRYFSFKFKIAKSIPVKAGKRIHATTAKGGRGVNARYRYVSSIEFVDQDIDVVKSYTAPHYEVETEGFWRRLQHDKFGSDAAGNPIRGKTWVKSNNEWRKRSDQIRTIYIKSSIESAKIKINEYILLARHAEENLEKSPDGGGVLYVLRCTTMKDEVYKVGWTSGTAEERAEKLSSATGVPSSFVVVNSWQHPDPEGLEEGVHAMLAPYRINDSREFFQIKYETIKRVITSEISRASKILDEGK